MPRAQYRDCGGKVVGIVCAPDIHEPLIVAATDVLDAALIVIEHGVM
jgi:hypothetical protein